MKKTSSLAQRLLTAAVGLPIVVVLILLPYANHLALNVLLAFATILATWELRNNVIGKRVDLAPTCYLGALLPIVEWANLNYFYDENLTLLAFITALAITGIVEVKRGEKDNFKASVERMAGSFFLIAYPGLFMSFLPRLTTMHHTVGMMLLFLAMVFGSDTLAFFTGVLFGKNNKGFLKASPNKSIAGFVGGTILVSTVSLLIKAIFPSVIICSYLEIFLFTLVVAIFGTVGDLFESLIKRSCGVKDAGNLLPGMGGMLDRIDSISFAAPAFIILAERLLQ